jgi:hypothetical protein
MKIFKFLHIRGRLVVMYRIQLTARRVNVTRYTDRVMIGVHALQLHIRPPHFQHSQFVSVHVISIHIFFYLRAQSIKNNLNSYKRWCLKTSVSQTW